MARILILVVCASFLSFALASDSATTKPSGSTTTKQTTAHTTRPTTLPPTTHTPTTQLPTESPALEKNNTFILYDGNKVCLKMIINMTVVYTYKIASDTKKTVTLLDSMDGLAAVNNTNNASFCRLGGPSAWLTLMWRHRHDDTIVEHGLRTMSFSFSASQHKGKGHWTFDAVHLDVVFFQAEFPDYSNSSTNTLSYKSDGFFKDKVEYQRGYQCLASTDYELNNLTDSGITAKVTVKDFRVQVFDFKTPGEFGNFRNCLDNGNGSKIVPIAVGVALAVLVIAVIIAFIISKLVNRRRQTSYETLN